jgi:hypothetical protein
VLGAVAKWQTRNRAPTITLRNSCQFA